MKSFTNSYMVLVPIKILDYGSKKRFEYDNIDVHWYHYIDSSIKLRKYFSLYWEYIHEEKTCFRLVVLQTRWPKFPNKKTMPLKKIDINI